MSEPQYPVSELVSQQIQIVLSALTAAPLPGAPSVSGYNTQLSGVVRYKHVPPPTPATMLGVVFPPNDTETDGPIDDQSWERVYQITVYYFDSEASAIPYEQAVNIIAADVEKILLDQINPAGNNGHFNGTVQNLWPLARQLMLNSNEPAGINIFVRVEYRTDQWNPYILR